MKLIRSLTALVVMGMVLLFSEVNAAPDAASPAEVTQALYHANLAHSTGFNKESVVLSKKWVTPDLYARILKKLNQPVPKGDAPDIEGDLFLDCQDPPNKFEIGKSSIDETKAKVEVILIWPSEKRHLTVLLTQLKGAWKVYDVIYDKDGKLTDLL